MSEASSRRAFIKSVGRYTAAGGVLAGLSLLVLGPARGEASECLKRTGCSNCDEFDGCELAKAVKTRESVSAKGQQAVKEVRG
jgi:hypothetical protein